MFIFCSIAFLPLILFLYMMGSGETELYSCFYLQFQIVTEVSFIQFFSMNFEIFLTIHIVVLYFSFYWYFYMSVNGFYYSLFLSILSEVKGVKEFFIWYYPFGAWMPLSISFYNFMEIYIMGTPILGVFTNLYLGFLFIGVEKSTVIYVFNMFKNSEDWFIINVVAYQFGWLIIFLFNTLDIFLVFLEGSLQTNPLYTLFLKEYMWEFLQHMSKSVLFTFLDDKGSGLLPLVSGSLNSFWVTSLDTIHSFWVPILGVKVDAIPGGCSIQNVVVSHGFWSSGYYCSEYCGNSHSFMVGKVITFKVKDFYFYSMDK